MNKISNGLDLVYHQADLIRKYVSNKVLKEAERLLPIGSLVYCAGIDFDKWCVKKYSINHGGEIEITVQKRGGKKLVTGELFEIVNCVDF